MKTRREAIFALSLWQTQGTFPAQALAGSPVYGGALEIVGAVLRHRASLEWILKQCVQRLPSGELLVALMVGAAQLLYMPSMAEHAAISETVEASKRISKSAGSFVNAILRRIQREKQSLLTRLAQQPEHLQRNIPNALWKRWIEHYGLEQTRALAEAIEVPPRVTLQALPPYTIPNDYERHPDASEAMLLPHGKRVDEIPGFAEGHLIVQDLATRHAIDALELTPGLRVLDACAAPGGKTAQIAARLEYQGELIANELSPIRFARLKDTLQRCHSLPFVTLQQGDATTLQGKPFQRILLDVPCSNTGVLGRRPDARWTWSARKLKELLKTQLSLLDAAAQQLTPDGILVYSTCSIEPEEDHCQIEAFLTRHPDFICTQQHLLLPTALHDGSYVAQLRRC